MLSQTLIVDTIRNWQQGRLTGNDTVVEMEADYAKLFLVTKEPEYYGNPEFEMVILWDINDPIDTRDNPRNGMILQLMRSFAYVTGLTIKAIRHEGLSTYVDFKSTKESKNVVGWEWVDVIAPKPEL